MLIISRQVGESIVIGQPHDQWTVTVAQLSGDKVRLGITSPHGAASPHRASAEGLLDVIQLSEDIVITIVDIRGDKVRIGVKVPATITVHRLEIYEAIRRERGDDTRRI